MQDKENHYENLPRLTTCSSTCKYSSINDVHEKKRDKENPSIPKSYFKSWYKRHFLLHLRFQNNSVLIKLVVILFVGYSDDITIGVYSISLFKPV